MTALAQCGVADCVHVYERYRYTERERERERERECGIVRESVCGIERE